jgi:NTE family protein
LHKGTKLNPIIRLITTLHIILFPLIGLGQQKVGLVLSGGGASGLAHIGVLKALEERGIPIDYITGTSAGSLVGAMYCAGYSPEEIENYVKSNDFQLMTTGKLKASQRFLYREADANGSLFNVSFALDTILTKSLPTKFITSSFFDFEMLKLFGTISASNHNNFDSLFIPFRCVASDIENKKSIIFSSGFLNQAVRASMTYPFYLDPIRIDGTLMFDGGLYNNFPADVMYQDFSPDFIIGSNVSYNAPPPSEDDLISQLTNMLVSHSNFSIPCNEGILIEPENTIGTFAFNEVEEAIQSGYEATMAKIDSIEFYVDKRITKEEITSKRNAFRKKIIELKVSSITNNFSKKRDLAYARKSMIWERKNEILDASKLERRYYRLYATPQLDFMYPLLNLRPDSTYNMNLEVRKAKDFKLDVGGHFSSRAVNTGYIGLTYRSIGNTASSFHASSYFGKFYGSAKLSYELEVPSIFPISASAYFVMNRWDYFRSFATFFEDVKPSFLIQNEMYYGIKINHPIGNTTKSSFDYRLFNLEDDYYQTDNFTNKDTSDLTLLDGYSFSWEFVQNSLNRKQFANSGHYFRFKARFVDGFETSIPGSTSISDNIKTYDHKWININAEFQTFPIDFNNFHFGIHGKGVFNSQSLYSNYTASLLAMTSFSPLPDAETYFLPEYRSPQYLGGGFNTIFTFKKHLDIRLDGYYYQPFVILIKNPDGTPSYSKPFKGSSFMASASIIYNTIVGPLRATMNYFPQQDNPFAFQVSYGFILFNERAIR